MSPIGECCHDEGPCPLGAHATTGWCLAATGSPVLVITTLPCPPGNVDGITVTLVDPETGSVQIPQEIVPCGNLNWEASQLCDYDPETGELIQTFIQIFEFDPDTGILTITNVLASDPSVEYFPVGEVRTCTDPGAQFNISMTEFCYDPAGPDALRHGFHAWIFIDDVHALDLFFASDGTPILAPVFVECPDLATEACCNANTALLTLIEGNTDEIEALLATLIGHVDGLEGCCAASNVILAAIEGHVDGVEGLLTSILASVDGLAVFVDGIEGYLVTIAANTGTSASAVHLEDDPHVTGDAGNFLLAVRNDAAGTTFTDANGDYSPIAVDAQGRILTVPTAASPVVERKVDGKQLAGAGSIVIPDGVLSFAVTVRTAGAGVTINGPDFAAPVTLYTGQSIGHGADESNTLNGPITITLTAGSDANAIWVKP